MFLCRADSLLVGFEVGPEKFCEETREAEGTEHSLSWVTLPSCRVSQVHVPANCSTK